MRIGILGHLLSRQASYRQAGVSRYIQHLAAALPEVAPEDQFVLFSRSEIATERAGCSAVSVVESRWPTEHPLARIAWEQLVGPGAARQQRLDVLHAPVNVGPFLGRTPTVVTVHDLAFMIYPEQYPAAKRHYLRLMTSLSVRRASRVIAVSEATARDVEQYLRVPANRISAIPNGVDPSMAPVDDPRRQAELRNRYQLPERWLLFVGTLQPRKNLIGLLRALASVAGEIDLPLVVAGGKGWMYSDVFAEVKTLGISNRVLFVDYVAPQELALWYSAATAFVYPSLYEGFGLPVLEAMACGTPVLTSSVSSLPEVAGDAAIRVDPTNSEQIGAGLVKIVTDAPLREELRRRGLEQAARFSWEETARRTAAVYHQVGREAAGR